MSNLEEKGHRATVIRSVKYDINCQFLRTPVVGSAIPSKPEDERPDVEDPEPAAMSCTKKFFIGLLVMLGIIVCVGVGIMIYQNQQDEVLLDMERQRGLVQTGLI